MNYINEEFTLKNKYQDIIRKMKPCFGYNGFGELVYFRSYSRIIRDDFGNQLGQESWHDTVIRVIEGVFSIRKDWYIKNRINWNKDYWQDYAFRMAKSLFKLHWCPPGRGLWAMGTDLVRERGSMPLYNCSFTEIGDNWIEDLSFLMDALMNGVGVGFRPIRKNLILIEPQSTTKYIIPDTREGWCQSLEILLKSFLGGPMPEFDYSLIRPFGAPIKSFGGTASGPDPLEKMHREIETLCYRFIRDGNYDEVALKTDIANLIGVCVVSGNVRRSAEIALCEIDDPIFMELKDYKKHTYRQGWGFMSNNSVILSKPEDYERMDEIAQATINGSDIGFLNMNNVPKGRICKDDGLREDRATGLNPCQPVWAWVLTQDGLRQFKDISEGDLIWSETEWVHVAKKWSTGINQVWRYHTTAGTFYGTENHELVSEGWKFAAKDCLDVDILPGPDISAGPFDPLLIVDGLVLGDGHDCHGRVVLNIGEKDGEYFESKISHLIEGSRGGSDRVFNVLTSVKIDEVVSLIDREIPERFLKKKPHEILSLLCGLFSANGCVIEGARVSYKTASIKMVEHIQMLLSSVGIRSYYTTNRPTLVKHRNGYYKSSTSYDVSITSDIDIFKYKIGFIQTYKNEALEILSKLRKKGTGKKTYEIISKELISVEETFDITVDNSTHTYWTQGLNVSNCGEILLESRETCNISETLPTRCVDKDQWLDACEYATFYCSTVTLLPTHQTSTNAIVNRNRRIGVGIVDFTGWCEAEGIAKITRYLREGYKKVRAINKFLADEAGIPESIRCTTIKPGGSVPKLPGRTSGAGYPTFRYTLRRINIGVGTPVDRLLIESGLPYEDSVYTPNTHVFEYPIEQGPARPATEVTLWQQAMNVILLQREWADNAVSNTLYFKKEEQDQVADVLAHIAPLTKSVSLLPHSDVGIFKQMPEQGISKEEYERRVAALKPIDWQKLEGSDGEDEKFCVGDACIVPRSS